MKKPDIRYLYDMKKVLYDKNWAKSAPNFPVYYVYREVKKRNNLKYDITVIPPGMLGKEFAKTKGHHHLGSFKELYIVLSGKALFLLQKNKGNLVKDVYTVEAKKGESCLVPPNFGHITINPTKKVLKTANWVIKNCGHDYSLFEKLQGACYYYTKSGWIKNKNYGKIPKLHFKKPLKSIPKNLDFLKG